MPQPGAMLAAIYLGDPLDDHNPGVELDATRREVELTQAEGDAVRLRHPYVERLRSSATHWAILTPDGAPVFSWAFLGGAIAKAGDRLTVPAGWAMPTRALLGLDDVVR